MRKLICCMHVSLNGFVCSLNGEQDGMTIDDHEMGQALAGGFQRTVNTMLIGKVLYQGFAVTGPQLLKARKDQKRPENLLTFCPGIGTRLWQS